MGMNVRNNYVLSYAGDSGGGKGFTAVCMCFCLFFSRTISQKTMQLGSPNLMEIHLFWDQKVKGQSRVTKKTLLAWVFALLGVLATSSSLVRSTRIVYMNIFIYQEKSGSTKLKSEKRKSNRLN